MMAAIAMLQAPAVSFPKAVFVIWWAALIVAAVVVLPLAVYLLHRTWRAARNIRRYAAESLAAASGIAANTTHVQALEETVRAAGEILEAAKAVKAKAAALGELLAERVG